MCVLSLILVLTLTAQASPCDPGLMRNESDPLGYRLRDERCEGRYVQQVAGITLTVASFTAAFAGFTPGAIESLSVVWPQAFDGEVHLRAQGLRPRLYYRMDVDVPGAGGSYSWPADMVTSLDIPSSELGVAGWIRRDVGGELRDVYLPLRVAPAGNDGQSSEDGLQVVLKPGAELAEVYVTLARVGDEGEPGPYLRDGEPLGYGYYPAERGTVIPLPELRKPGIHYLEIGARLRGGGSAVLEAWIYHPGEDDP